MPKTDATDEMRFSAKVDKTETCWLWLGATTESGYGYFRYGGKTGRAHRFSFETFVGPIPDGMVIDHACHTPACVNPGHLNAVTIQQNIENRAGANRNSILGVRGVSRRANGTYTAFASSGGRRVAETFPTLEQAAVRAVELRNACMTNNLTDRIDSTDGKAA